MFEKYNLQINSFSFCSFMFKFFLLQPNSEQRLKNREGIDLDWFGYCRAHENGFGFIWISLNFFGPWKIEKWCLDCVGLYFHKIGNSLQIYFGSNCALLDLKKLWTIFLIPKNNPQDSLLNWIVFYKFWLFSTLFGSNKKFHSLTRCCLLSKNWIVFCLIHFNQTF